MKYNLKTRLLVPWQKSCAVAVRAMPAAAASRKNLVEGEFEISEKLEKSKSHLAMAEFLFLSSWLFCL